MKKLLGGIRGVLSLTTAGHAVRMAMDAEFKESDHPRAENGKFGSGGGGGKVSGVEGEKSKTMHNSSPLKAGKSYAVHRGHPDDVGYSYIQGHYEAKEGESVSDLKDRVSKSSGHPASQLHISDNSSNPAKRGA